MGTRSGKTSEWVVEGTNQDREEFNVVGSWGHPGRQSYDMATGVAKYPRDLVRPGALYAECLRSPYGHARVLSIDTTEAEALEGVVAVITWEDPELSQYPLYRTSWWALGASPLLGDEGEFEGDECGAVVVAVNEEVCHKALDLLKVEWEVLPFVIDPRDAAADGAPVVRPEMNPTGNLGGNTFGSPNEWEVGNVEQALGEAEYVEEYSYGTPNFCQVRSMPAAYLAYWDKDPWGNPNGDKICYVTHHQHFGGTGSLASAYQALDSDEDHFRAMTPYMASRYCDFVEKRGAMLCPYLSKRLGGVPVRYAFNRRQSFDANVPATYYNVRIGFNAEGVLTAVQGYNVHQSGARGGYSNKTDGHLVLPPQMTAFKMTDCPNIYSEMAQVLTNGSCTTADPGKDKMEPVSLAFAVIADKLGMDVSDVIMKNVRTVDPSLTACMKAGKEAIGWDKKWHLAGQKQLEDGRMHGMSCRFGLSMQWGSITYNISLALRLDGKVYMPYTEGLIGTFWPDAAQLVIAEELGMKLEDVVVYYAPHFPNWTQGDAADRGSSVTWAAKEAAIKLKEQLLVAGTAYLGVTDPAEIDLVDSCFVLKADPTVRVPLKGNMTPMAVDFVGKPSVPFDSTFEDLRTMNVDFCEVAVDTETGEVEIINYLSAHDFGKVIRPSSALGQLEQALTMASGVALREEVVFDPNSGVLLNGNMYDYKPATALDQPHIVPVPVETRCGGGAYGSTGVAHAHVDRGLTALAVQNAIGSFIDSAPCTPDKVLRALGKID